MFQYVSIKEAIGSRTADRLGINNNPSVIHYLNMEALVDKVFVPVREHFNTPIYISSFYRSPELNKAIGGAKNSQHAKGEAMDLDADVYGKLRNSDIGDYIKANLDFDQLIFEFWDKSTTDYSWIHVSYKKSGNRKQVLEAYKDDNGKTKYRNI